MAESAVSFVVERLGELLIEKASSLINISDNVKRLQRELIWMQGFLKEADAWPHRDDRIIQNIVAEVRDLSHDAEDIIESHAVGLGSPSHAFKTESKMKGWFRVSLGRMFNSRSCDLATKIDEFTSRINELGRRLQTYGFKREAGERGAQHNSQEKIRRSYSHLAEQGVIGLEDDAEKIATQLVDGMLRSLAVSICGMGGIGKTTLAKKVYSNARVRRHFRCFAWACVSQQCNIRDVWEGILNSLTSSGGRKRRMFSDLRDHEVVKELYQLLMKEKCLVVLDDIWTKEAWDCLRAGFPEGNTESKILLTTRNKDVALHVDPNCLIHSPRCLNESQSWELFLQVAIRHRVGGFTFDETLEELGRRIVDRCGGLPFAIKTVGGNLRTKSSLRDWAMVHNNMLSHLSGLDNGMTELGLTSLLALSYHDLPYQLKQCFLYFSQFPEDFIIPADTIINIWVAEGIIRKGIIGEEEPVVEVEDIAYAYLEELVSRCMVQVEKWSSTGRIKSFRLHDLMRDLCIQVAKKENFFHAKYVGDGSDEASMLSTSTGKVRRLALYMKNSNQNPCLNYDRYAHLRSLLVFSINMNRRLDESHVVAMAKNLKYLRLLYIDVVEVDIMIPGEIGDLVHLRLLDIGSTWSMCLPSSLGKLTRLLTLKLDRIDLNSKGRYMENIFENMHELRHLYLPRGAYFSSTYKLSHLRNLQTLVNMPLACVQVEDLAQLVSLRKLELFSWNSSDFDCLVKMFDTSRSSTTFNKLQTLSVRFGDWEKKRIEIEKISASCPNLQKLKLSGPLVLDLPPEGSRVFRQLNKLTLKHSDFVEDPMPHLGKLPNLKVLRLHSALGKDAIMFPRNSFPCLQSLVLSQEQELKEWIIEEGALPRLSFLKLYYCVNLKTVPEGLEFLDSLQELRIVDMPPEFTERMKRGGEDFHKVEKVSSVLVEINLQEYKIRDDSDTDDLL